jgi:hypothetical protein
LDPADLVFGVPFVFKDEQEAGRFGARIKEHAKEDSTEQVKSMTVSEFANEARPHADVWRQALRAT